MIKLEKFKNIICGWPEYLEEKSGLNTENIPGDAGILENKNAKPQKNVEFPRKFRSFKKIKCWRKLKNFPHFPGKN